MLEIRSILLRQRTSKVLSVFRQLMLSNLNITFVCLFVYIAFSKTKTHFHFFFFFCFVFSKFYAHDHGERQGHKPNY